jgi:hypothetical protein
MAWQVKNLARRASRPPPWRLSAAFSTWAVCSPGPHHRQGGRPANARPAAGHDSHLSLQVSHRPSLLRDVTLFVESTLLSLLLLVRRKGHVKPVENRLVKQTHRPHMAMFASALGIPQHNMLVGAFSSEASLLDILLPWQFASQLNCERLPSRWP